MDKFKVKREHYGDKYYQRGDVREADAQSVAHLVRNGVLVPVTADDQASTGSDEVAPVVQNEPLPVDAGEPLAPADEPAAPEEKAQAAGNAKAAKKAPGTK